VFEIRYSKASIKSLLHYDEKTISRIRKAINLIPKGDIKKLQGRHLSLFRLRVGKYRIIFRIENDNVFIDKIDTRGDIYK